jgi:hypothetical protein
LQFAGAICKIALQATRHKSIVGVLALDDSIHGIVDLGLAWRPAEFLSDGREYLGGRCLPLC